MQLLAVTEFVVWQWEDQSWRFYPVSLSISLEKAFQSGQDSFELKRGTAVLEVDLKKYTEYIKKSKVTNDIKRSVEGIYLTLLMTFIEMFTCGTSCKIF